VGSAAQEIAGKTPEHSQIAAKISEALRRTPLIFASIKITPLQLRGFGFPDSILQVVRIQGAENAYRDHQNPDHRDESL
jgi:hypothetical protein